MMKALPCTLFAALVTLVTSPTAFADIVDVEFLYIAEDSTTGAGSLTVTAKGINFTGTMPTPTLNQKDSTAIVVPATAVGFLNDDSDTGSPGTTTGFHLGWSGSVTLTGTVEDLVDPNTLTSMAGVFNNYEFDVDLSYEIGDAYSYEIDIFDDNGEIVPNDAVGNYRIAGWMGDDDGGRRESTGTITYGVGADTENNDKSGGLDNEDSDGDDVGITIALREAQGDVLFIDRLIFGGELQQDDSGVINSETSALVRRFVTLDPDIIPIGGTSKLSWVINPDAASAIIEPGSIDALAASDLSGVGEVNVMPILTTTYTLTVTPTVGTAVATEALVTVLSGSPNAVYAEPAGGWECRYDGNVTPDLVGWDHSNDSDKWDGSGVGPGLGKPGGVSIHDDGVGNIFCRIQNPGDPRDYGFSDNSNRKIYFTKDLDVGSPPYFDDDDPLTDEGVTLYFRSRVAVDSVATGSFPLDDAHPDGGGGITPWPAGGDGFGLSGSGKGPFGIFADEGGSGSMISFGLTLAATDGAAGQGLSMNAIATTAPDVPSPDIDTGEGVVPNNLVAIADPTEWQDVWVSIYREDFGGLYMNRCEIYRNGALTPVVRYVTCGKDPGYGSGNVFLGMGMGDTQGEGAYDIDFFYAKYGNHIPEGAEVPFQITEVTYTPDPAMPTVEISWPSLPGQSFILERTTLDDILSWEEIDDSYPAADAPATVTTFQDGDPSLGGTSLLGVPRMLYRVTRN
jgi:hypothetical protein